MLIEFEEILHDLELKRAAAMDPSGATEVRRVPARPLPRPSQNHHGTPFIAVITAVFVLSSGAMPAATAAIAGAFTATITIS